MNEGYRSAGISRYILQLLQALPAAVPELDLNVFATEPLAPQLLQDVTIHTTRLPVHKPLVRLIWEQTFFAFTLLRERFALLHSLAYVSPWLCRVPSVVTIYDLSFYLYPHYLRPMQRLYLQVGTRASVRRARRVLTISESSKRDLTRLLGVPPERVDVAAPGIDPEFSRPVDADALAQFRQQKSLPEHFVLFLGTREPRKNIPTLIRAFAQAKRAARLPHQLVIAGGRGWMDEAIPAAVAETGIESDLIMAGFVEHAELPLWYRAADAFVYPSQYEGFGMPALEALASGTPTIVSNVSSLPEAVGDAGILVAPGDVAALSDALVRVLTEPSLRADLVGRGRDYAAQFTWHRTAQRTGETYRRALGMSAPVPVAVSV